jgi:hypothetical protein
MEEHLVGFIAVQEITAAALTDTILRELQGLDLDTNDCHSQGYDMVGMNSGAKTKILSSNKRAFFTACGCHNWNLLLGDAIKSSRTVISFFFIISKNLHTIFQIFEEVGDFKPGTRNNFEASF